MSENKIVKVMKEQKAVALAGAAAVLILILLFLFGPRPLAVICLLLFLAACAVLAVNFLSRYWLTEEKPSSYFQDLGWRNVPALMLGSTAAWEYTDFTGIEDKLYNCTTYKRSLPMDLATLKTYFSHVKPKGTVIMTLDYVEAASLGFSVQNRDWQYVHPHIFLALGKEKDKDPKKEKWPLFYYKKFTLGFFCRRLAKMLGLYKNRTWKKASGPAKGVNANKYKFVLDRVGAAARFCHTRGLKLEILLIQSGAQNQCANAWLKKVFDGKYADVRLTPVGSADEMNKIIREMI